MKYNYILFRFILNNLKIAKLRNILSLITITLTAMMFTVIFILGIHSSKLLQKEDAKSVGTSAEGLADNVILDNYYAIQANTKVKEASYNIYIGLLEGNVFDDRNVELRYSEDLAAKMCYSYPVAGRMPKERNEIVVDTYVFDTLGKAYELNQDISLHFSFLNQNYKETFKIVGYYKENTKTMNSMAFISKTYMDELYSKINIENYENVSKKQYFGSGLLDVMFNVKNESNLSEEYCKKILTEARVKTDETTTNMNPAYRKQPPDISTIISLAIFCIIIIITGYLSVYNIFQISVYKDVRLYGTLNTIGTTKKHIKRIIGIQALILGILGIPLGLFLGHCFGIYLLPKFIIISLGTYAPEAITIQPNIWIYFVSLLLTLGTVLYSCRKPVRIASKISPIEAIKYNGLQYAPQKTCFKDKRKSGKSGISHLAYLNLFRDRKKTIIVVTSMSMSCIMFFTVFTIASSFDLDKYTKEFTLGDLQIASYTYLHGSDETEEAIDYSMKGADYQELLKQAGIQDENAIYYGSSVNVADDEIIHNIEQYVKNKKLDTDGNKERISNILQREKALIVEEYFISNGLLENLNVVEGDIDTDKFSSGNSIIVARTSGRKEELSFCHVGDIITLNYPDTNSEYIKAGDYGFYKGSLKKEYAVMAVVDLPMRMQPYGGLLNTLKVIAPLRELSSLGLEAELSSIVSQVDDERQVKIEEWLSDYINRNNLDIDYVSKNTVKKSYMDLTNMIKLVGGSLAAVIAIIGVLNYMNSVITSIISRKKEFAVLRSIGMTDEQLKAMLIIENLYYILFIAIVSILGGIGISFLCVTAASNIVDYFTYTLVIFPIIYEVILFLVIAVLLALVGYKFNTGSIIESIREDI